MNKIFSETHIMFQCDFIQTAPGKKVYCGGRLQLHKRKHSFMPGTKWLSEETLAAAWTVAKVC